MTDPHTTILAHLLDTPAVQIEVGRRVYAGRDVPPAGYDPSQGGCIVFKVRGGMPDYSDALHDASVQFKCYGLTEVEAYTVYAVLFGAMQNATSANIAHAECEVLGQPLYEPDTHWPFVLAFFNVMVRQ